MPEHVSFRIEVNIARNGAEPMWRYLMEDEYSSFMCESETEARLVMQAEERGANARLIGFTINGIGTPL